MIEITRILCPVDFSECSRHALDQAVALARWYQAHVTAVHVFTEWPLANMIPTHPSEVVQPGPLQAIDRDALMHHLQHFVGNTPAADVQIDAVLQEAPDVHREILAQADALKADLIVLGSHGRSGFERFLLGSITEKVLRKATCPVMVVPRRVDDAAPSRAVHASRILCPVDFSGSSLAALTFALSLAEEADAVLTALHVVEIPSGLYESSMSAGFNVAEWRASAHASSLERLQGLIPDSVRSFCTVDTLVSEGKASRVILGLAEERHCDLIVMGAQGRGGLDLVMFGSNTHDVIRAASCPVLTVHGLQPPGGSSSASRVEHAT
jgi:nucleotide-binding universal stress UspA family protein